MATVRLHYIYDPLCGWCYGAAPLALAAQEIDGLDLILHGGGMMTGSNSRTITPEWHDYVIPHDRRIAQMTGQTFGEAYYEGLLRDTSVVLDSAPPTAAVLAAEAMDDKGMLMLHEIERAHYVSGLKIVDAAVLRQCAEAIGLDGETFSTEFTIIQAETLSKHISASRELLAKVRGQGFPTFALEDANGNFQQIPAANYLGQVDAWRKVLTQRVNDATA
ncbi:DsbA family protein [Pectobacterium quasiaquaticum]|uniref:DsbA family protein n=1 Tax=Pectobacterium quasiaquaticum TaxID=2774015 RepID=A0A9Q2ENE7_9GAMM|nr:DsbA family protein [Pectobacterium quasiaquaticum]MBE5221967.1 DsbA family protein [Pectobacterium quasiaquaticum]URG48347.1 DsbA family protein [Pectobacterium quasiaquaticum]